MNARAVNVAILALLLLELVSGLGGFLVGQPDTRWMFWVHREQRDQEHRKRNVQAQARPAPQHQHRDARQPHGGPEQPRHERRKKHNGPER